MKKKFPSLKKKLKDFIEDESGIISKENIIKGGIAVGGILALSQAALAHHVQNYTHTNAVVLTDVGEGVRGTHTHDIVVQNSC